MSEKHIENIDNFAKEHGVFFKQKGECGFGRPCVGLLSSEEGNYVDYNPTSDVYDDEVGVRDDRIVLEHNLILTAGQEYKIESPGVEIVVSTVPAGKVWNINGIIIIEESDA